MKIEALVKEVWKTDTRAKRNHLDAVPARLVHTGPTFEVHTKNGEKLTCSSQFYYWENEPDNKNLRKACEEPGKGFKLYIEARNQAGEIVGMRNSTAFDKNRIVVRSKITVKERGQGYATPIEEAFIQTLQWFATQKEKRVVWEVTNSNKDELKVYELEDDPDQDTLAALRKEQERWQHLYGNGGKFGIKRGKKIFYPNKTIDDELERIRNFVRKEI